MCMISNGSVWRKFPSLEVSKFLVCVFFLKMSRWRQQYILVQYNTSRLHLHFAHVSPLTVCCVVPIGTHRKVKIASFPQFYFRCWSFQACATSLPVNWFIVADVSNDWSTLFRVKNVTKFAWIFGSKSVVVAILQKGANCFLVNMT